MRTPFFLLTALVLLALPLRAQNDPVPHHRSKPADAAELSAISERGKAIAAYDAVAWHATDAVQAVHAAPDPAVRMYLGKRTDQGWTVAFGKLNEADDTFLLAYQTEPSGDFLHPRVTVNTPPLEDHSQWLYEARAYELARSHFAVIEGQPYNGTVLPGPNEGWYVYFYPAQTKNDVFPSGADTRFLVSHDGKSILETRRMHMSLLQNEMKASAKTEMSFHTAVLDDAPEDTDVANVLMMGGIPMLVVTKAFVYKIQADGAVMYVSPTSVFLKDQKK